MPMRQCWASLGNVPRTQGSARVCPCLPTRRLPPPRRGSCQRGPCSRDVKSTAGSPCPLHRPRALCTDPGAFSASQARRPISLCPGLQMLEEGPWAQRLRHSGGDCWVTHANGSELADGPRSVVPRLQIKRMPASCAGISEGLQESWTGRRNQK